MGAPAHCTWLHYRLRPPLLSRLSTLGHPDEAQTPLKRAYFCDGVVVLVATRGTELGKLHSVALN